MDKTYELMEELLKFRNDRDWEQFHDTKNLALAISIEAAELNELFLWKNNEESENIDKTKLKEELADVLIYSLLLTHRHGLNAREIIMEKIKLNSIKYPIEKSKGNTIKYTDF